MSLRVSTTGSDVVLNDIGIAIIHPTIDRDLREEFTAIELKDSIHLTNAIQNGDLTVKMSIHSSLFPIAASDYDPDLLLLEELDTTQDEKRISHNELASKGDILITTSSGVFPVNLNSTAQATRNIYSNESWWITWDVQVGDIVEILGCPASGIYHVESLYDQQNFVVAEPIVDSTGGTTNIYHPSGATRIGIDNTSFDALNGDTAQELFEDIDNRFTTSGFEDQLVKVSSNDTIQGYLVDKITTSSGLQLTELNDGGDEDLVLGLDIDGLPENVSSDILSDYIVIYHVSTGIHKKVMLANLPVPAVGAYGSGIYLTPPFSWSDPVPLNVRTFQTLSGMHDPTNHSTGTATGSQTSTTLQDTSKSWTINEYTDFSVRIASGTGAGQWRNIASNTSNTLTISNTWDITPDATSAYEISNSSRLIVPKSGIYNITAHCSFQSGTGAFGIAILQNNIYKSVTHIHHTVNAELTPGNTRFLQLTENDYIQIRVWNGYDNPLLMNTGALRLYLEMNRIGG